jgi:hypothetical protein
VLALTVEGNFLYSELLLGLAVDWIAGNVYWTDPKFNVIEMARLNGSCRYVVVTGNLDKPTAIAVDPLHGFLFWSDSGKEPRLERSRLDGSDRFVLVNDTGNSINDIALDYEVRAVLFQPSSQQLST